ncbi:MAG: alpha/beta hydrolase [Leptolyngbya sp. Prado105]|nr:alpha/beta hydrolase [Leptolyngbya sp. Prado105]
MLPYLTSHSEIWAIDLLGFGFTEPVPLIPVNPQSIRQHLLGILQAWITQPVILIGASLGGAVAIDFTLHYPDWVKSLILIDSVGFSGSFPIGQFLPSSLLELGADWLRFRKQTALKAAATLPLLNSTLIDALRCSLLHQEMPGWKEAIISFSQTGGYADLSDRMGQIQHPTLILWGRSDDILGTQDAARFQAVN